jgi:radical SAM superfamily enzyme YgiQ (UPF0313 family)
LRILFVNPPSPDGWNYYRDTNRSGRRSKAGEIWPQAGLALFAGLYPDHDVRIIDCIAEKVSYSNLYSEMKKWSPDWVVFNPVSCTITSDMAVAYMAKHLGAKTVAISPHLKALPGESGNRFQYLDHTVENVKFGPEPEYQLRELITGESSQGTSFENLPPARQDLLPIRRYSMPFIGSNYTAIYASRGCSFGCIYCRTTVATERKARYRNVDSVIEEIRRYHLTNFIFHADTTTLNHRWLLALCKELRKLPFKCRIVSNSRVDTINPEVLAEMKSAGWWMIAYGIESGDDRVLAMNKKEATVEQARKAIRWTKEAGIKAWGYFMLGMYGDNRESMERTVSLSLSEPFDIVNFSISAPYPGTEWGDIAQGQGWLVDQRWEAFDQNYSAQVSQPGCPPDMVKNFQRSAYLKYYLSHRGVRFALNGLRPEYLGYFAKTAMAHLFG